MGVHEGRKYVQSISANSFHAPRLPMPNNIGKIRRIKAIDGTILHFRIEDEIIRYQSSFKRKIIVLQKIKFIENGRVEFRFGYYMIGMKPKVKGRWVWGQFCLMIPQNDLLEIIAEAKRRKWFKLKNNR